MISDDYLHTMNMRLIRKKRRHVHAAWEIADVTVQKVESVIRGFSYLVPGTMWNRWLTDPKHKPQSSLNTSETANKAMEDIPPSDLFILQQQLVDRLIDEGHAYMTIRNVRMEDMYGKKGSTPMIGSFDALGNRVVVQQKEETTNEKVENSPLLNESNDDGEDEEAEDDDEIEEEDSYMYDFAAPGPTTAMFDTMLDTMACTASQINNRAEALRIGTTFP